MNAKKNQAGGLSSNAELPIANCGNLARLKRQSSGLLNALEKIKKLGPELEPLEEVMRQAWTKIDDWKRETEFEAARKKDKGEVLWTLFFPRTSAFDRQQIFTRTPHTLVKENEYWTIREPVKRVCAPGDAYDELRREWRLPDAKLMAERQRLVESKPRDFWYHQKEEAA